jgi:hypothetical protein
MRVASSRPALPAPASPVRRRQQQQQHALSAAAQGGAAGQQRTYEDMLDLLSDLITFKTVSGAHAGLQALQQGEQQPSWAAIGACMGPSGLAPPPRGTMPCPASVLKALPLPLANRTQRADGKGWRDAFENMPIYLEVRRG